MTYANKSNDSDGVGGSHCLDPQTRHRAMYLLTSLHGIYERENVFNSHFIDGDIEVPQGCSLA